METQNNLRLPYKFKVHDLEFITPKDQSGFGRELIQNILICQSFLFKIFSLLKNISLDLLLCGLQTKAQ